MVGRQLGVAGGPAYSGAVAILPRNGSGPPPHRDSTSDGVDPERKLSAGQPAEGRRLNNRPGPRRGPPKATGCAARKFIYHILKIGLNRIPNKIFPETVRLKTLSILFFFFIRATPKRHACSITESTSVSV